MLSLLSHLGGRFNIVPHALGRMSATFLAATLKHSTLAAILFQTVQVARICCKVLRPDDLDTNV